MTGTAHFPNLFSPIDIGSVTLKNRIVLTGHHTHLAHTTVSDRLIAYLEARARGGTGLIITEVAGIHETARYAGDQLMVTSDECVPGFQKLASACQSHGAKVFGQLFHPGREVLMSEDGTAAVAWAPSAVPGERRHVMPREMPVDMIHEVIEGYGRGTGYLRQAGFDGVEIVASHGYLPTQFLNPISNRRSDEFGGDLEGRLRFLRLVAEACRAAAGDMVVGLRISVDEQGPLGLGADDILEACERLDQEGLLDYFSVVLGSAASLGSSIHIVPPMEQDHAYVAPFSAKMKARVSKPVLVTGRINQPQDAEQILANGEADLCGMTRAQITDPELAQKAKSGKTDDIRACIGCNQACAGHGLGGYSISCIQRPESGRELKYGGRPPVQRPKKVFVAGGGPAGLKAAAVAAERGHEVTLFEKSPRLGGQVNLAQALPGRAEFGGIITNLERECQLAGVRVHRNTPVDAALLSSECPDALIVATGAKPFRPAIEGDEDAHVVDAWQVLLGEANVGGSVAIADWRCDWIGLGLAEKLLRDGCRVRLCVNGVQPGEMIQQYTRDSRIGTLHKLGVEIVSHARLIGVDEDTAYFQHSLSGEAILCEGTDTLVLALGHSSDQAIEAELGGYAGEVLRIGDCLAPRTAEEAVFEGLKAGFDL